VRDAAPLHRVLAQDGEEVRVRVALVQEHRFTNLRGEFQLGVEGALLRGVRREISEVVEPAFTHRDDLGLPRQLRKLAGVLRCQLRRVVRMHPRGREQLLRPRACQRDGPVRALER
jgi:hypothetical protein